MLWRKQGLSDGDLLSYITRSAVLIRKCRNRAHLKDVFPGNTLSGFRGLKEVSNVSE